MTADRLLQHYQRIADAPDAIARLRRFILDLAVRGKLTSYQFQREESVLLGKLSEFIMGQAPPGNSYNDKGEGTVFVKVGEFGERFPVHASWTTQPLKFARRGDVLICVVGATIGKLNLSIDCAIGRSVAAIRPHSGIDQVFLYYSLMPITMRLREDSRGTAQGVISRPDLAVIPIWCPPLAEQHRIVAKVDELMGLCDRLQAARAGREGVRDRLAAASLARLNTPDPDTFQHDTRFALDALPALTTRPDQIKALRQTILNLAVRGKLVPQDTKDESASEWLLRAFGGEAARRSKKVSSLSIKPLERVEAGYTLPTSWLWMELGKLITVMDAGWSPQCENHPRTDPETWGVLKTTAVQTLAFDCRQNKELPAKFEPRPQHEAQVGDILVTRAGPKNRVGVSCAVDKTEPRLMISDKLIRFRLVDGLSSRFFALTLNAGITSIAIEGAKSGMAVMQMNISQDKLRAVPVPLPPLAEQHRIVAKVDALMALCDQMEASLTATDATRRRLADALLAEALAPVDAREPAPAD